MVKKQEGRQPLKRGEVAEIMGVRLTKEQRRKLTKEAKLRKMNCSEMLRAILNERYGVTTQEREKIARRGK